MGENSNIEWTDHTFNPWRGCAKVSPACAHCYAETLSKRNPTVLGEWGRDARRPVASENYWRQPLKWNRQAEAEGRRLRVFCASLADVFENRTDLDPHRRRLWELIAQTPHLDWLLLTKRPDTMATWADSFGWPDNAWAGTTVEDQRRADERIPHLLRVPARVRFLSVEPLLGSVDLEWVGSDDAPYNRYNALTGDCADTWTMGKGVAWDWIERDQVHWVIVGGESGPGARPMHPAWVRALRDQCVAAGVPFHFKQWGAWAPGEEIEANGTDHPGMYEPHPEDGGAPMHYWPDAPLRARCDRLLNHAICGDTTVYRLGKKKTGRLLDGRTWDELPEVSR